MTKLSSIIIPVYNAEQYLEQCVTSIVQQGLNNEDFEIIIVDDGSTDKSLDVARKVQSTFKDADITIATQPNQGSGAARNKGMSLAKGTYIEFVDSDDYLEGDSLKPIINLAFQNDVDVLEFRMNVLDANGNGQRSIAQPFPIKTILSSGELLKKGLNTGSTCTSLYKLDFLKRNDITFPVGINHEDVVFSSCVYSSVEKIMFTDFCPYVYRWNPNSKDRSKDYSKVRKSIMDDLYVIVDVQNYLREKSMSGEKMRFFHRRGNSTIVGTIFRFLHDRALPKQIKSDFIDRALELGLYPIHGRTSSFKTTLLIPLLNCRHLIQCLF